MNRATLTRYPSTDQGTAGRLRAGDVTLHTLELPWRDNRTKRSCIPAGEYLCRLVNSPRFGRVYNVVDVPGRSAVLIHSGNLGGDIALGYDSHIEGCILLGEQRGVMTGRTGKTQLAVLASRPALRRFMDAQAGAPFTLLIQELP